MEIWTRNYISYKFYARLNATTQLLWSYKNFWKLWVTDTTQIQLTKSQGESFLRIMNDLIKRFHHLFSIYCVFFSIKSLKHLTYGTDMKWTKSEDIVTILEGQNFVWQPDQKLKPLIGWFLAQLKSTSQMFLDRNQKYFFSLHKYVLSLSKMYDRYIIYT